MPVIADQAAVSAVRSVVTEAHRLAEGNWGANAEALARRSDPVLDVVLKSACDDLAWVFARDGCLTAFEPGERWLAGCSVPLLAARAMLKPLDGSAGVACFLAPAHAAQVRIVLERVQPTHAVICIVPDARALGAMLRCDDFSADIARGRLWLAAGGGWADSLALLLAENPGLPTPTRFVRMPDADAATIDTLISQAQQVFAEQNARRTTTIASLRDNWIPTKSANGKPRVAVLARSTFRLWDDAGDALWSAMAQASGSSPTATVTRFDPDEPAGSSPLALATAAAGADMVVAADGSRADAPRLVPPGLPWITWVTTPRIPPFASAGPNDRLLVADPAWEEDAARAGWPAGRVALAGWPRLDGNDAVDVSPKLTSEAASGAGLALIADTFPLDVPEALAEFSSHGLLWERIRHDVTRDPFAVPADAAGYIRAHARAAGIDADTLDLALFADRLVVPAYQQALAEAVIAAGLPLRLHGSGWSDLPRFAPYAAGPVTSRAALGEAARSARALIHAWPHRGARQQDALGCPVVRRTGTRKESFLRDARVALRGTLPPAPHQEIPRLSPSAILDAIRAR